MNKLRIILIVLIGLYVSVMAAAYAFQDKLVYFTDSTPATVPKGLSIDVVEVMTSDDESLVAWHLQAEPNCPTMLMFHGNAGHLSQAVYQYRRIENAGVGMLALSWRGYAGSTGTPSEAGLYEDAASAYVYLKNELGLPSDDIVVHGFSLGTGPAVKLATEVEARALVLEAPYFSALRLAKETAPILPVSLIFKHSYRSDLRIGDVQIPILIAHGDSDSVIPAKHSADLAALAPERISRVVFKGSDHNTLVRDGLYEVAIWPYLKALYPDCAFNDSSKASSS